MTWLDELDAELRAARVPVGRRRRIAAELADHLQCDPGAQLGDPRDIARRFADELGSEYARRAAVRSFSALAPIGLLFFALLVTTSFGVVNAGVVLGTQLAFVGGMLALVRAWRLRRSLVISAADAAVLRRRAELAVAGGVLTLASIAAGIHSALAWTTVGVGAVLLASAARSLRRASAVRPLAAGPAHDFSWDLMAPVGPWALAGAITFVVVLAIAVDGLVTSDPYDGLVRAFGDGALCLAGFALLGRRLGLRRQ